MTENQMAVLFPRLMHLADSALPIGGFAFSNGLEWMIKTGNIVTVEEFNRYLLDLITQAASFDLVFIRRLCDNKKLRSNTNGEAEIRTTGQYTMDDCSELLDEYDLMIQSPGIRRASFIQGKSWIKIFPYVFASLFPACDFNHSLGNTPHFLYVFSRSMNICGIPVRWISRLYLYMIIRDQVNAAVRLGCIGPGRAQKIQAGAYCFFEDAIDSAEKKLKEVCNGLIVHHPCRQLPMLEIAQGAHGFLYSKLFQN